MPSELYFTTRALAGSWCVIMLVGVLARCCQ
jgi:hypothetical protein